MTFSMLPSGPMMRVGTRLIRLAVSLAYFLQAISQHLFCSRCAALALLMCLVLVAVGADRLRIPFCVFSTFSKWNDVVTNGGEPNEALSFAGSAHGFTLEERLSCLLELESCDCAFLRCAPLPRSAWDPLPNCGRGFSHVCHYAGKDCPHHQTVFGLRGT